MKVHLLTTSYLCRLVCLLQSFLLLTLLAAGSSARGAELRVGENYSVILTDVDQHQLSTADGHVTMITVVTRKDEEKAELVGDRYPHSYLADPRFRLVTLLNFQQKIPGPFRRIVFAIVRQRLETEAKEVQKIFDSKRLNRKARDDMFVVADFDGKTVSQLGLEPTAADFVVLIFDGKGRLTKRWNEVPSSEALMEALDQAP